MGANYNKITSKDNSKFKHVRQLLENSSYRKKSQQTVLEGTHLIQSCLQSNICPTQIWVSETALQHEEVNQLLQNKQDITVFEIEDKLYKQLRSLGQGIDILAVINQPKPNLSTITTDSLILNDVQDTGNVGTLIRTAAAIGIQHILCTTGTASVWSPKCLRAGMGAHFSVAIYENIALDDLIETIQTPLFATSSHTQNIIYHQDLSQSLAWVMGNEGQGVCEELMAHAHKIALPQPNGQESLNVAIAGSLCMYEMLRQRNFS